ncbi:MAG TPA: pyridoxal phosphate-dependent aminotransferase [Holophagaceae bacterium]|nr:pyridoxal phosphate-dependent aminotransferase [Holophagaceae bacterium]
MHRSSRLPELTEPNALTRRLQELRAEGREILDLTVSNPTVCGFDYPEHRIREALSRPEVLRYAPEARGLRAAREAIAAHHGHGVRAEDILLTASTSEAYALLFKLLGDPGDEVLVPSPSYPLFEWLARLEGMAAHGVPAYFHEGWHLDLGAMEAALTPRTRAVVVVNPNNPTGAYLRRGEWAELCRLCDRHGLALLVDEVFAPFPIEPDDDHLPTALEDTDPPCPVFVLSGLSKLALLPQVKLGWIIARGQAAQERLEDLDFLADQYLSVSASAQAAAPELLALAPELRAQALARARGNLATLDAILAEHPSLSRLPVGGGWSALLRRPALDSDEACALRLLESEGVLAFPGHFFDLPAAGYLVLSLLTAPGSFQAALRKAAGTIAKPLP